MNETARVADDIEDIYGLSPMQVGMLLQSLLAPSSGAFFEQQVMTLDPSLDVRVFSLAWEGAMAATPVLRTSFHWEDLEKPVQVVHRTAPLPLEILDWSDADLGQAEIRLADHLFQARTQGFQLDRAPLFRLSLIRAGLPRKVWFVWHFHHILLDGWSGQMLMKEVADRYSAHVRGLPPVMTVRRPYSDYINWLGLQDSSAMEAFWRGRLGGITGPTRFAIGNPPRSRAGQTPINGAVAFVIPPDEVKELREFVRARRLTMNTLVQGAWAILLARYSGEAEVLFGTVVSGRPPELEGIESMLGLFINILPTRISTPGERQVNSWLAELQARQMETAPFQYLSMHQIRQWSGLQSDTDPFETVLIFENFPISEVTGRSDGAEDPLYVGRTNVPLTVLVAPGDEIRLKLLYDDRRFDEQAIERTARHLRNLLLAMVRNPDARVAALQMLDDAEHKQVLQDWNDSEWAGFDNVPLMARLAQQAEKTPDAVAFIEGDTRRSFTEIEFRSTQLAAALVQRGVVPGAVVAVSLIPSIDAVETFLAILKARAVYLPLDPSYPETRLRYMLADAVPDFLIADDSFLPGIPVSGRADPRSLAALGSDDRETASLPEYATPDDNAYIIYTSGSTGRPKGVAVQHRQMLNRLDWIWREYPWQPGEVGVMRTALNFVDSFQEMLGGLLCGVPTVVARSDEARDPEALVRLLARHDVTRVWFVPSFLSLLLDTVPQLGTRLPKLTFWSSGGEPLSAALCRRFADAVPHGILYNTLGASEIWDGTFFDPDKSEAGTDAVPIGKPIANVRAFVIDRHGQPAPIGVVGELSVAGACLARGYIGQAATGPDMFTALSLPGVKEDRVYRTGDLVRWRDDGVIDYVGRADFQMKLNGYRIDPFEVESALTSHPQVAQAVVTCVEEQIGRRLVAHVVPVDRPPDRADLMAWVGKVLPRFMVPSQVVFLDGLPRTPSGKVDRRSLPPAPSPGVGLASSPSTPPRTPLELSVQSGFQSLLGLNNVDREANFFSDLGGHSLLAARLVSRLREDLGIDVPLRLIFDAPTIAGLSARLAELLAAKEDAASAFLLTQLGDLDPAELQALLAEVETESKGAPQ
jgi:amino acid adenylation domain-containing protein